MNKATFFIPATLILAEIVTAAIVPLPTLELLPRWLLILAGVITLIAIFSPVLPVRKQRR